MQLVFLLMAYEIHGRANKGIGRRRRILIYMAGGRADGCMVATSHMCLFTFQLKINKIKKN